MPESLQSTLDPGGSWLDDFNKYLNTAGAVVSTVKSITQPTLVPTTTPIQAQPEVKTALAETTDAAAKPGGSAWLILGAIVLAVLLLE
jgi:hypothetical protein